MGSCCDSQRNLAPKQDSDLPAPENQASKDRRQSQGVLDSHSTANQERLETVPSLSTTRRSRSENLLRQAEGRRKDDRETAVSREKLGAFGQNVCPVVRVQGSVLAQYSALTELQSLSFTSTCLAEHKQTHRSVLIQRLAAGNERLTQLAQTAIQREIEALRDIDHPHVLKIRTIYQESDAFYLISETLQSHSVRKAVELRGSLEGTLAKIAHQVLSALKYCHSKGIFHCNLQAESILIATEANGQEVDCKIIGFGSAKETVDSEYTAPEVLKGEKGSAKADIWSCGVLLFYLFSGVYPGSIRSNLSAFLGEKVSAELRDFLLSLLTEDCSSRPSASECLSSAWLRKEIAPVFRPSRRTIASLRSLSPPTDSMQAAVIQYISSCLLTPETQQAARAYFEALDVHGNGELRREELEKGFTGLMNPKLAKELAEQIMASVDFEKTGTISYSEFLFALTDTKALFTRRNLRLVFSLLDTDSKSYIQLSDLQLHIRGKDEASTQLMWRQFLQTHFLIGSAQLTSDDFAALLQKIALSR